MKLAYLQAVSQIKCVIIFFVVFFFCSYNNLYSNTIGNKIPTYWNNNNNNKKTTTWNFSYLFQLEYEQYVHHLDVLLVRPNQYLLMKYQLEFHLHQLVAQI